MAIWFDRDLTLAHINQLGRTGMAEHLGMEFTEVGEDFIKGCMPVDTRTRQPYGLLHGGASAALAETLGSLGAAFVVDRSKYNTVGLEINANHVRGVREGYVTGIARPLHIGKTTQVWEIRITDERDKLVCVSRLTVAIIPKSSRPHHIDNRRESIFQQLPDTVTTRPRPAAVICSSCCGATAWSAEAVIRYQCVSFRI